MLTVNEVAERLRVAPITVYRWCYAGKLKSLKIVGVRRIEEEALEEFKRSWGKAGTTADTYTKSERTATGRQPAPPKKKIRAIK